ncbi:MAG: hypothetical protein R2761_16475 [Acidimicrobiales bacterium]
MRTEQEAADLAEAFSRRHRLLEPRRWRGDPFAGGWIVHPEGEDLQGWTGVVCLVVLDDGRIFTDNGSTPREELVGRYSAPFPPRPAPSPRPQAGAEALAAAYGRRFLAHLGPRTWRGIRFDHGWYLKPEGEDLARRFDLPAVVVLDDGRLFEDSGSQPEPFVTARYADLIARESTAPGRQLDPGGGA